MSSQVPTRLPEQFEQLRIGIALFDPESGTIVDANESLESMFGYSTETLRELSVEAYSANTYAFSRADVVRQIQLAADGRPQRFKWRIKRQDGTLIWIQIDLSRLVVDGEPFVLAEIRDITKYTDTSRRVSLLSRIMRHNLRNDLTVIAGRAQQIQSEIDTDHVSEHTEKIEEKTNDIDRMTESVREIERATTPAKNGRVHKNTFDVVMETVDELSDKYPNAKLTVEEQTEMWFSIDAAFNQALRHAIENGIVHSNSTAPSVTVTVDKSPNTGRVEVSISDSCPPIPDIELDALDESIENTDVSHGTGVGLFVMKWCVESLGGEITFDRANSGNTVSFYFPPEANPSDR
ncbi:PAS domain-containing sensor histidine kinase [Haloarcula sp. GH36]|uniref:PAS domain-containing sensor histidine kinase n=1 Tax=Haloarcula montana TaxID=3111776 RepID=UPI002D76612B|nr:PAS domain-containing sensor histidine kinase [Haloarcula sp. GH36]